MSKPIVAVFGITGKQGGSVARSLIEQGKFAVRGITRDSSKPAAKEFIDKGVEIIQGDANNADDLRKLFKGVTYAFVITNFWDQSQMGKEAEVGKLTADIAKESNVKHYIWSTLANVEKISNGKYDVPHFTQKSLVDEHIINIGLNHTFLLPATFLQNFLTLSKPKKDNDGVTIFASPISPDKKVPYVDIDQTGIAVVNILNNIEKWNGKWVPLWGDNSTNEEYAKTYEQTTGNKSKFVSVPKGSFGEELQNMLDYISEYGYYGPEFEKNKHLSKELVPEINDFKSWITKNNIKF